MSHEQDIINEETPPTGGPGLFMVGFSQLHKITDNGYGSWSDKIYNIDLLKKENS